MTMLAVVDDESLVHTNRVADRQEAENFMASWHSGQRDLKTTASKEALFESAIEHYHNALERVSLMLYHHQHNDSRPDTYRNREHKLTIKAIDLSPPAIETLRDYIEKHLWTGRKERWEWTMKINNRYFHMGYFLFSEDHEKHRSLHAQAAQPQPLPSFQAPAPRIDAPTPPPLAAPQGMAHALPAPQAPHGHEVYGGYASQMGLSRLPGSPVVDTRALLENPLARELVESMRLQFETQITGLKMQLEQASKSLQELRENAKEEKSDLVASHREALADLRATMREQHLAEKASLNDRITSLQDAVSKLQKDLDAERAHRSTEREKAAEERQRMLEELTKAQRALSDEVARSQRALADQTYQSDRARAALKEELQDEIATLKTELAEAEREKNLLERDMDSYRASIEKTSLEQMSQLRLTHQSELATLAQRHQSELAQMRESNLEEIRRAREDHHQEKLEILSRHQAEIEAVRRDAEIRAAGEAARAYEVKPKEAPQPPRPESFFDEVQESKRKLEAAKKRIVAAAEAVGVELKEDDGDASGASSDPEKKTKLFGLLKEDGSISEERLEKILEMGGQFLMNRYEEEKKRDQERLERSEREIALKARQQEEEKRRLAEAKRQADAKAQAAMAADRQALEDRRLEESRRGRGVFPLASTTVLPGMTASRTSAARPVATAPAQPPIAMQPPPQPPIVAPPPPARPSPPPQPPVAAEPPPRPEEPASPADLVIEEEPTAQPGVSSLVRASNANAASLLFE